MIRECVRIVKSVSVCYELNEGSRDREIKCLADAMNRFNLKEGIILAYNQEDEFAIGGKIKVVPVGNGCWASQADSGVKAGKAKKEAMIFYNANSLREFAG